MNPLRHFRTLSRRGGLWLGALASALALYAIAGFFVLPAVLKSKIPQQAGALLGREVALERVRTNPFTLSITLEGFRIKDSDGEDLLGWNRLYVNAQLWPLLRRQLVFKAIDLDRLRFRAVIEKNGRLNFSDILDRLNKDASSSPSQRSPTPLFIEHLRVAGAQLIFLDRSLPQPFMTTLGPLGLELDRFQSERDTHSPYAFRGWTEAGESFAWRGTVSTTPLRSAGLLALDGLRLPKYEPYYRNLVGFELQKGLASAKASYEFEWSAARHAVRLNSGELALSDLALAEKNEKAPALQVPALQVSGIEADLLDKRMVIASVALKDLKASARRSKDGRLNLQTLFQTPEAPASKEPTPLHLQVHEVALTNGEVAFEDQVPARPVRLALEHIEASMKDLTLEPDHVSPVDLSLRVGGATALQAKGTVAPLQASGDLALNLENLELPPLDPYLDTFADARLSRGRLGLDGRLRFAFPGKKEDGFSYLGELQITDFEARDSQQNEPFLRWKRLRLAGTEFASRRPSVVLKSVEWTAPEARLVMAQNGVSNVARALRVEAPGPVASAVPPGPATPGPEPLIRIAKLSIHSGRLSFIDRSLEPNAVLLLSEMEGMYTGLSTEASEATQVDFKGKAGGLAAISIQGRAMPLRHDKDTDVTIKIDGADLTDFSPYTGKYLGYTTRQGKLDVDARVRIQERRLNIEDKVRLDRMYLGDKVDSPDATHLPVKLGLAILRDRKGVIELEVPVDGSLDDPDIHYGRMIWKAVLNVLGKAITSPFTLLSKMFGSGEDLSAIAFPAGGSSISAAEQKKLDTLAKALNERPELKLELEGTTDPSDVQFFRQRELEDLLRRAKWKARKIKVPATPEEEVIDPAEREQWLRAAFNAVFPPPKGVQIEPPPLPEMEQRLLESIPADPDGLRQLAKAREKAAIDLLLQGGQIEAERIFTVQGSEAAKAGGSRVFFNLK